jgi:hypothetical protein
MQGAVRPPGGPPGPAPAPGAPGGDGKNFFQGPKGGDDEDSGKARPYVHLSRLGAAWLLFGGSVVMCLTLFAPWWSWNLTSASQNATFYIWVWGVFCSGPSSGGCPGASSNPVSTPTIPALVTGGFPANMGALYGGVAALAIIAAILGFVSAAIMFFVSRGLSDYPKAVDRAVLLAYLSLTISLLAPIMLSIAQPYSFRADFGFPLVMAQSPGTGFSGLTGAGTFYGHSYTSMEWGPTYAWYLCILAAALFFGGAIAPQVTRHEPVARRDLIRSGLLKLQAPIRRPLPAGMPMAARPFPAPYPPGGRALPPPMRPSPMYAGYGPQYTSVAPGVGWARPPPAMGGAYRPPAALPPGRAPPPSYGARPPPAMAARPVPAPYRPPGGPVPGQPLARGPVPGARPAPVPTMAARPVPPPVGAAPPAAAPPSPSATPGAARPAPPPVRPLGNRNCPNCQTFVPPPALRCTKCGTLLPRS